MVRMHLPFSMGTPGVTNPVTFEQDIRHPILNIGSSYSSIKTPIMQWLAENYGNKVNCGFDGECEEYYIDFPTEADVTWFKLRWMS